MASYYVTLEGAHQPQTIEADHFAVDEHWVRFYPVNDLDAPLVAAFRTPLVRHIMINPPPRPEPETILRDPHRG
jgi:hypothetical protein